MARSGLSATTREVNVGVEFPISCYPFFFIFLLILSRSIVLSSRGPLKLQTHLKRSLIDQFKFFLLIDRTLRGICSVKWTALSNISRKFMVKSTRIDKRICGRVNIRRGKPSSPPDVGKVAIPFRIENSTCRSDFKKENKRKKKTRYLCSP